MIRVVSFPLFQCLSPILIISIALTLNSEVSGQVLARPRLQRQAIVNELSTGLLGGGTSFSSTRYPYYQEQQQTLTGYDDGYINQNYYPQTKDGKYDGGKYGYDGGINVQKSSWNPGYGGQSWRGFGRGTLGKSRPRLSGVKY